MQDTELEELVEGVNAKRCSKCGELFGYGHFHKLKLARDGLASACKFCTSDRKKRNYKNNKQVILDANKKWRKDNKPAQEAYKKEYYATNKERIKQQNREWNRANPHIMLANKNAKRARKRNATPKWLTDQDMLDMLDFYALPRGLSRASNIEFHVDHIVPLTNDLVCGLHVPWNLQILTASENCSKHNKFTVE